MRYLLILQVAETLEALVRRATKHGRHLAILGALAACSSDGVKPVGVRGAFEDAGATGSMPDGAKDAALALPCPVEEILRSHCQSCHAAQPAFGAPVPLVTLADLTSIRPTAKGARVIDEVVDRVLDHKRPMPPAPSASLSAGEVQILKNWQAEGAPAASHAPGQAACALAPPPPLVAPLLSCTPDTRLAPAVKWTMTAQEQYACFGFDVTVAQKRHVTAFAPRIDDIRLVHHLVIYRVGQSVSSTPRECGGGGDPSWQLIYAWAPGGRNLELPPEAGLPEEGTTHYVVQIHYDNYVGLVNPADGSGVDLCTTEKLRPNDAEVIAFGSEKFTLAPRATTDITCAVQVPPTWPALHLIAAFPHMHKRGKLIETWNATLSGPSGDYLPDNPVVDLGAIPSWDFANQPWVRLHADVRPMDVVKTRCAWENDGDREVSYGVGTDDEMCYSFTMYYPRVNAKPWQWAGPAVLSTCSKTVR